MKAKAEHIKLPNVAYLGHPFQVCGTPGRRYHFESASCNPTKMNAKQWNRGSDPQGLRFNISNLLPNPE